MLQNNIPNCLCAWNSYLLMVVMRWSKVTLTLGPWAGYVPAHTPLCFPGGWAPQNKAHLHLWILGTWHGAWHIGTDIRWTCDCPSVCLPVSEGVNYTQLISSATHPSQLRFWWSPNCKHSIVFDLCFLFTHSFNQHLLSTCCVLCSEDTVENKTEKSQPFWILYSREGRQATSK